MARTALVLKTLTPDAGFNTAAAGVYQAADDTNDMYIPASGYRDGLLVLHCKNANAATRDVVVKAGSGRDVGPAWRSDLGDLTVTLAATTGEQAILITDTARFKQADGTINVDISGANVTIAPFVIRNA